MKRFRRLGWALGTVCLVFLGLFVFRVAIFGPWLAQQLSEALTEATGLPGHVGRIEAFDHRHIRLANLQCGKPDSGSVSIQAAHLEVSYSWRALVGGEGPLVLGLVLREPEIVLDFDSTPEATASASSGEGSQPPAIREALLSLPPLTVHGGRLAVRSDPHHAEIEWENLLLEPHAAGVHLTGQGRRAAWTEGEVAPFSFEIEADEQSVVLQRLRWNEESIPRALVLDWSQWEEGLLVGELLTKRLTAEFEWEMRADASPVAVRWTSQALPIRSAWLERWVETPVPFDLELTGGGQLTWPLQTAALDVHVRGTVDQRALDQGQITLRYEEGLAQVESCHLAGAGFDLQVTGQVDSKGVGTLEFESRLQNLDRPEVSLTGQEVVLSGQVQGDWESPRAEATLVARDLRLAEQPIQSLTAQLTYQDRELRWTAGEVLFDETNRLALSGRMTLDDDRNWAASLRGSQLSLSDFVPFQGEVDLQLKLSGTETFARGTGSLVGRSLARDGLSLGEGQMDVEFATDGRLRGQILWKRGADQVEAGFHGHYAEETLDLALALQSARWHQAVLNPRATSEVQLQYAADRWTARAGFDFGSSGRGTVDGFYDAATGQYSAQVSADGVAGFDWAPGLELPPEIQLGVVDLNLALDNDRVQGQARSEAITWRDHSITVDAEWELDGDVVQIETAAIDSATLGGGQIQGTIDWPAEFLDLRLTDWNLHPASLLADWDLAGEGIEITSPSLHLVGSFEALAAHGSVRAEVARLAHMDWPDDPLTDGRLELEFAGDMIRWQEAGGHWSGGALRTSGQCSWPDLQYEIEGTLEALELVQIVPSSFPLTGTLQGTFLCRGDKQALNESRLHVEATGDWGAWQASGQVTGLTELALETSGHMDLAPLAASVPGLDNLWGQIKAEQITIQGPLDRPEVYGQIQILEAGLAVADWPPIDSIQAEIACQGRRVEVGRITGQTLNRPFAITSGHVDLDRLDQTRQRIQVSPIELEQLAAFYGEDEEEPLPIRGQVALEFEVQTDPEAWRLAAQLEANQVTAFGLPVETALLRLAWADEALSLERLEIDSPFLMVNRAQGALPLKTGSGRESLEVELLVTRAPGDSVFSRLEGDVELLLAVGGSLSAPVAEVTLSGSDCLFRAQATEPEIGHFRARLTYQEGRVTGHGEAQVSGGPLRVNGYYNPALGPDEALYVHLVGEDLLVLRYDDLILRASPDVECLGSLEAPLIRGLIEVNRAQYMRDFELLDPVVTIRKQSEDSLEEESEESEPEAEPGPGPQLDLRFISDSGISIQNKIMTGFASADLHLTGPAAQPILLGLIRLDRGEVFFQGNNIQITEGEFTFTKEELFVPQIHLQGQTQVGRYDTFIEAHGNRHGIDVDLQSSPSLSETQIINLLVTGVLPDEDGPRGGEAAFALTRSFEDMGLRYDKQIGEFDLHVTLNRAEFDLGYGFYLESYLDPDAGLVLGVSYRIQFE